MTNHNTGKIAATTMAALKITQILRLRWKVAVTGSPDHDAIEPQLEALRSAGKVAASKQIIGDIERNMSEFKPDANEKMCILAEHLRNLIDDEDLPEWLLESDNDQ